jgi:hypothetical protein
MSEPEKKAEFDYVAFCNSAWKTADDAWRPRRTVFDESWALFWNRYDFSKKAPWQSKNFVPKMNRMVRTAVFAFKDAIVGMVDYFSVDGVGKQSKERAWVVAKILKYWLDTNDFVNAVVDSLFASLLSSLMVFKIYWENVCETEVTAPTSAPQKVANALAEGAPQGSPPPPLQTHKRYRGRLRIEKIDPNKFRIDPTGRKKYAIHEYEIDLHDLVELAKNSSNRYDSAVVAQIQGDYQNQEEKYRERLRKNEAPSDQAGHGFRRTVVMREYWGEVFKDGELMGRNMTFTIANDVHYVRKAFKNPYLPDEGPFVWGAPLRVPFSNFHQSFAEAINGLCRIATEVFNLTMDANLWASIKAFELDLDQVADPNQIKNGIYPGKVLTKRNRGIPRQMITPLDMGVVNPQNLSFYGMIERETGNSTGVNEFTSGISGQRKIELATEYRAKSEEGHSYLGGISREVEENILDKILEKCWKMVLCHQDDFSDDRLKEMLGEEVSNILVLLSEGGRQEYLGGKYEFRFRGMSATLAKGEDLKKVRVIGEMIQSFPELKPFIKLREMAKRTIEAMNWNPEELIEKPPEGQPPPGVPSALPPTDQGGPAAILQALGTGV